MGTEQESNLGDDAQLRFRMYFPDIRPSDYEIAGAKSDSYNCVAFAMGDLSKRWDPTPIPGYYWPLEPDEDYSVDAYVRVFERFGGFEKCADASDESCETIAIFAEDNEFTHVAIRKSGRWASKMGDWELIEHGSLEPFEGGKFGAVVAYMKRRKQLVRETKRDAIAERDSK